MNNYSHLIQTFVRLARGDESQLIFSQSLGYTFNVITKFENGTQKLYWDDFVKILKLKDVNVHQFIFGITGQTLQTDFSSKNLIQEITSNSSREILSPYFSKQKINRLVSGQSKLLLNDLLSIVELIYARAERFILRMIQAVHNDEFEIKTPSLDYLSLSAKDIDFSVSSSTY